jgi:hypothetical protein
MRKLPPLSVNRLAVYRSNVRSCSDGFEFRCDDGSPLHVTLALDCHDREAISGHRLLAAIAETSCVM